MNTPLVLFLGTIAGGGKGEFLGGINTPLYNSISFSHRAGLIVFKSKRQA